MQILLSNACAAHQYTSQGIAYFERNEFAKAVALFDIALQLSPDDPYAHWNRATALLSLGEYQRGFKEHEWAWRLFHWRGFSAIGDVDTLKELPIWRGERDCRVLAYHELGHGDAIMAMRYLDEMASRAEVTLVVDLALARLARSFAVHVTERLPQDLDRYDFRLPFFGVMAALDQTAETIPAAPYIERDCHSRGGKVGIAWSGRTQTAFSLNRFLTLFDHEDFSLYALQPGTVADDRVTPLRPGCDFDDLADLIAELDHIVCVDTAAIHLAGAMGHPSAHLVLPWLMDWRWHRSSLWYPALHTYRQETPSDWTAPFDRLNEALHG